MAHASPAAPSPMVRSSVDDRLVPLAESPPRPDMTALSSLRRGAGVDCRAEGEEEEEEGRRCHCSIRRVGRGAPCRATGIGLGSFRRRGGRRMGHPENARVSEWSVPGDVGGRSWIDRAKCRWTTDHKWPSAMLPTPASISMDCRSTDSPQASSSRSAVAHHVFASLLTRGGGGSGSPLTSAEVREHFDLRLKDRRLQLSNPDRPRPKPERGSNGQVKLARRDGKARKQMGRAGMARGRRGEGAASDKGRRTTEGGGAAEENMLLSRTRRKQRGLDGLDEETR